MNAIKNPHEKIIRIGKGFDVRLQLLIPALQLKEMQTEIQPID